MNGYNIYCPTGALSSMTIIRIARSNRLSREYSSLSVGTRYEKQQAGQVRLAWIGGSNAASSSTMTIVALLLKSRLRYTQHTTSSSWVPWTVDEGLGAGAGGSLTVRRRRPAGPCPTHQGSSHETSSKLPPFTIWS